MLKAVLLGGGTLPLLAALWGVAVAVRTRPQASIVIAASPVAYALFMMRSEAFAARLMLPVLPFVAVFAGVALGELSRRFGHRRSGGLLTSMCAMVLLAEPASRAVYLDLLLTRSDSRRDVEDWFTARPEAFAASLIDEPTVAAFAHALPEGAVTVRSSRLARESAVALLDKRTKYVALSNIAFRPEFEALYRYCEEHGTLVFESSPYRVPGRLPTSHDVYAPFIGLFAWARPGVVVRVYRLR